MKRFDTVLCACGLTQEDLDCGVRHHQTKDCSDNKELVAREQEGQDQMVITNEEAWGMNDEA